MLMLHVLCRYNGELLEEHEAADATHVIADDRTTIQVCWGFLA